MVMLGIYNWYLLTFSNQNGSVVWFADFEPTHLGDQTSVADVASVNHEDLKDMPDG